MTNVRDSFPLPWVERYRPKKLEDVLSQNDIIQTLTRFIESGQLPHLLLHGPPGTGKTSTVQAIAQKLYGANYQQMVLELNASDDRGIATVRDTIKVFAETTAHLSSLRNEEPDTVQSHLNRIKLIILDEADQMTGAAQMALRRIIENYTHVARFFIICNYMNKINPALQSRCTKFRFPPVKPSDVEARIQDISISESVTLTSNGMKTLFRISQGDMRRILNYLQSATLCQSGKPIDENAILETAGLPLPEKVEEIFYHLRCSSFHTAYTEIKKILKTNGYSLTDVISSIYEQFILLDLPITVSGVTLPRLADLEYHLSQGANELIQLGGLVALFIQIRQDLVNCSISKTPKF